MARCRACEPRIGQSQEKKDVEQTLVHSRPLHRSRQSPCGLPVVAVDAAVDGVDRGARRFGPECGEQAVLTSEHRDH
eukprot:6078823-Prymnesium_polylepis.1